MKNLWKTASEERILKFIYKIGDINDIKKPNEYMRKLSEISVTDRIANSEFIFLVNLYKKLYANAITKNSEGESFEEELSRMKKMYKTVNNPD